MLRDTGKFEAKRYMRSSYPTIMVMGYLGVVDNDQLITSEGLMWSMWCTWCTYVVEALVAVDVEEDGPLCAEGSCVG
jgi:hypothetical protein